MQLRTFGRVALVGMIVVAPLAGCSSSGDSAPTTKAGFCALVIAFKTSNDALGKTVASSDPAKAKATTKQVLAQVETLQKKAPDDVQTDVDIAAEYIREFDALMAKYHYDLVAVGDSAAAAGEFQALATDEVNAALARLGTYATTECGVGPTTTAPAPAVTTATSSTTSG